VRLRQRALLPVLTVAVLCAGAAGLHYYRAWQLSGTAGLVRRLPTVDATVVHVDVAALRQNGLLAGISGTAAIEEPEYRAFVDRTGFDYKKDLDTATVAFAPGGVFFLLQGRFDWNALKRYVEFERGTCKSAVCEMAGSKPDRVISFLPLRSNLMALTVSSSGARASSLLRDPERSRAVTIAPDPVWVSVPGSNMREVGQMPAGTRSFVRAVANADQVVLSFGADGERMLIKLLVECRSEPDAQALANRLQETTELLRSMIAREKKTPNPGDFSGVLTSGVFRREGTLVRGRWPIEPEFLNSMLSGRGGD
jgi:hypothetical protein